MVMIVSENPSTRLISSNITQLNVYQIDLHQELENFFRKATSLFQKSDQSAFLGALLLISGPGDEKDCFDSDQVYGVNQAKRSKIVAREAGRVKRGRRRC
jgi:hypothetical protein